ncbi:hypothetical protein R3P38DRAFT_2812172 [Favolaschia claudopus]|uniref:Uncharacterized protein n=1 Tax=Favolaschia claudopus TaxID=2862362 RepID=A0AAV9Z7P9_9AGAR
MPVTRHTQPRYVPEVPCVDRSVNPGHGDALYPFRTEPDKSFMGEHNALQPPSTAEFRLLGGQILTTLDGIVAQVGNAGPVAAAQLVDLAVLLQRTSVSPIISTTSCVNQSPPPNTVTTSIDGSVAGPLQALPALPPSDSTDDENSDPSTAFIPISGAIIPGVGKDSNAWKRVVDQWYHGDPAQGLMVALKDWPLSWYTGQMRLKTGALYCNRRLLAEEYERMGCDEKKFMETYPEYPKITQLLKAIRQRKGLVRKSS